MMILTFYDSDWWTEILRGSGIKHPADVSMKDVEYDVLLGARWPVMGHVIAFDELDHDWLML